MNARSQVFEFTMEGNMVSETVLSLFHTVLFHRSLGKFNFSDEATYSVSTLGYEDVDCDYIDFTYVCCVSDSLDRRIKQEVDTFSNQLRSSGTGQISLEFFTKRRTRWLFTPYESVPWEVWTVRLDLQNVQTEDERQMNRERLNDLVAEKVMYITEVMNRHEYVPKMPNRSEMDLVFDTTHLEVQPYLWQIKYNTTRPSTPSMSNMVKKVLKDTLSL